MESLLHEIAHYVALAIEAIAIAIIAVGALEAVIGMARVGFNSATTNDDRRAVWLIFARWLVAGLTFSWLRTSSTRPSRRRGTKSGTSRRSQRYARS